MKISVPLSKMILWIPPKVRRSLADTRLVHAFASRLFASTRTQKTTPEGIRLCLNPIYHAELLSLSSLADYEPPVRHTLVEWVRPGMVVYDVGANIGLLSCLVSNLVGPAGTVVAFEPEKNNSSCLRETIRLNALQNIRLEEKAVGERTGTGDFDHRGGAFSGRLVESGQYRVTGNISEVPTVALDDYVFELNGPPPDLLKIDVEGNELSVLLGMRRILRSVGPNLIVEIHSHLGDSPRKVIELLRESRYQLFELPHAPHTELVPISKVEGRDWLMAMKSHPKRTSR